jgi:hypothetical protein
MGFPLLFPMIPIVWAANNPELGKFLPNDLLLAAPLFDSKVSFETRAIAGFFMGVERLNGLEGMDLVQTVDRLTDHHMKGQTQRLECVLQIFKAFTNKQVVLRGSIWCGPKRRLHKIDARDRSAATGFVQGRMILHTQIAFKPNELMFHVEILPQPGSIVLCRKELGGVKLSRF